ncbi:TetR/AcrR family transcriptional regulator [Pendulispora rubella]|uniref:TetR/AcrR family transcriptional regulator n=1 Tax=Pendulispora rubella TaxID=2741070 RepID=A0ABZ2LL76_9BACT
MPRTTPKRPARPARRKPIQERSQETVRAIVDAAARILPRRGYAHTTTNEIAARAGVSIGSLYEYFRDKDAIVRALIDRHFAEAEAMFEERVASVAPRVTTMPLEDVLRVLVQAFLDFHADNPRLHTVLSLEVPLSRALVRRVEQFELRIVEVLEFVLGGHPESQVRSPRLSAQLCVQLVDALAHRWVTDKAGEPVGAQELADEMTKLLSAYVRAPS